jgi:hypothetical protein
VPFTERDDECLCYYLARIIPDKAAGGRLGLGVYKRLVDMVCTCRLTRCLSSLSQSSSFSLHCKATVGDSHTWGDRHTAESWKERYKKNAIKFDRTLEDIVKLEGRSRKQLWPQDRRVGHKFFRGKHKHEHEEEPSEEELSEGDEEEPPQPSRKRRRSDYSSSPPNRRRVVQRDEKGKARAEEEEEEGESDEPDLFEGLFSMDELEDEPGPSGSRRPLEATTVAADDLTHRTQPNTASFFTQETIVASDPSGSSAQSKRASHLPDEAAESSSFVRPSTQVTRGAKQASPFGHEPLTVIDITPPSRSTGRSSPVIQQSPTRTLVNPPQTQAAQTSTYKRPLKAARRPRAMIEAAVADGPYKNTRSRSQSVEPYTLNSPVRVSKEGGTKGKQRAMPELATLDEIWNDKVGEIAANEIEVEKMLIEDEDEEPDDLNQVRGVSLDTDDAQTEQNLRPTQPPRQVIPSLGRHPSEILKEFQEHSVLTSPLTRRSHLSNNRPAFRVRNTRENVFSIPSPSLGRNVSVAYKVAEPPRTPRRNSVSSTELFPVSGTRASALKKILQQQEKRSPYNPPSGTRAAQFSRSRN